MSSSCSSPSSSPSSPMSFPCVISALGNPKVDSTKPEPVQPVTRTVNELQPDQVLVQIEYASINSMDPLLQSHNFLGYQLPLILGFDFSGHVVAVGSSDQSRAFHIGDPVFGFNFAPPTGGSCFATHVVVQNHTLCKNTVIPARDACTYGVAFVTAYESLVTSGNIGQYSGKTIFIPGGAGGVGHFAVQIARALGLHVISSASKASSLKLLHDLKCDHVIDYSKQDVIQAVNELTNGQGVDLVFDSTLQVKSYQQSMQVLKKGGVWIKLGPWEFMDPTQAQQLKQDLSSRDAQVIVGDMGRYSLVPSYIPLESRMVSQAFHDAIQWYQQGVVRPSIHSCIPFEAKSLQHALDTIKQGTSQGGKIIMQIQQQTQQTQTIAKSQ